MKNGPGYLDVAVSSHLDMLKARQGEEREPYREPHHGQHSEREPYREPHHKQHSEPNAM